MSDKMMEDAFFLPVSVEDLDVVDTDNMHLLDCSEEFIAEYAAHAINQHDILTNRVKVLEKALSGLMAAIGGGDKSCGHDFTCVCAEDAARKALEADNG